MTDPPASPRITARLAEAQLPRDDLVDDALLRSLRFSTIAPQDQVTLTYALAGALDITVAEEQAADG